MERVRRPTDEPRTQSLFAIAVYRLLLGYQEPLPGRWNNVPSEFSKLLDDPAARPAQRIEILAYREIIGEDSTAELARVTPPIEEVRERINVALSGLASAMARDVEDRARWWTAALSRPYLETEQPYLFEMMWLARAEPEEVEQAANAVTVMLHEHLVSGTSLSVAPLVAGLAVLARRAGTTAQVLLRDRLKMIDEIVFADGETTRLNPAGPDLVPVDETTCDLRLTVRGEGRFDGGVDPAAALTRRLSESLSALMLSLSRRPRVRAQIERALDDGACRTTLRLAAGAGMSALDEQVLRRRVGIAWECARHQLRGVSCKDALIIERQRSGRWVST